MKHCKYFLDITGDESVVEVARRFVVREQPGLSGAREKSRALLLIFGTAVQTKIVAYRSDPGMVSKYSLDSEGKHCR
jgi:hypothetical protein